MCLRFVSSNCSINEASSAWGLECLRYEIRDIAPPFGVKAAMELQAEAKYFCIDELSSACETSLSKMGWGEGGWGGDLVPICRVPLITSQKEEQALINANNMKPVVKLLINRHNNKYSYTGASDDNLLKNIELFDKLSLRLEC